MATKKPTIEDVLIEEHINKHYKDFVYYVLEDRGIPSKYDGLINTQRLVLMNAPEKLDKTNSLIGICFTKGYKHGDASLAGVISKMCRESGNAYQLLHGEGFHGSALAGPAAPRYNECKANPIIRDMIKKYMPINEKDNEDQYPYINLDAPIGLCSYVLGIGVAYQSNILPRKLEDMLKYLDGGTTPLKPHFLGFKGIITKSTTNKSAWILSSNITIDSKNGDILISGLPPMMRYDTFLNGKEKFGKKTMMGLSDIISELDFKTKVVNDSKTDVDIRIKCSCGIDKKEKLISDLKKISTVTISENIIFADGDGIVKYDSIKEYLDDFKIFRNNSALKKMEYDKNELEFEMIFNQLKESFINYMTEKKRDDVDVKTWMSDNIDINKIVKQSDTERLRDRLKSIPAYKTTIEEAEAARKAWTQYKKDANNMGKNIASFKKENTFEVVNSKSNRLVKIQ